MKQLLPLILLIFIVSSCKSKKTYSSKKTQTHSVKVNTTAKPTAEAESIVKYAKTFDGTRYKYGGTTKSGMDCSGLIYTSYKKHDVNLPRTTSGLKGTGEWIDLKEVNVGDLVFFATNKNSRNVNHVGIVTNVRTGNVEFIHASTSRGVMISSIAEKYWYFSFVQARRVL
ncbi:cell wall-associated NlpC family hydrolase [Winogradskyella pacifica]|uniref:Cell wall-associated NlpC family hydrolase n=1 Tax=Winogradskyella pacifica TaxID=664642 RepID=A0A3D9N3Y8_9FLAO|nr:C40 family peptidase [Winogradskyella pacifica]REE27498.1 cell wall-associated NlpC family hydrolase [Winogradskyella pacifica]